MNNDYMIKSLFAMVEADKAKAAADRGHMSLGELAATLAASPNLPVQTDYGTGVGDVDSYRGYYSDLALEPGGDFTAHTLAARLSNAIGETFSGYKGGEYTMSRMTPVWLSHYGTASGLAITGVRVENDAVLLETTEEEW